MRLVLAVLLTLCMMCPAVGFGEGLSSNATDTQIVSDNIPTYTNTLEEEGNGRPQKLDANGERIAEDLNPVERRIIVRDTIITNRPNLQNRAAE